MPDKSTFFRWLGGGGGWWADGDHAPLQRRCVSGWSSLEQLAAGIADRLRFAERLPAVGANGTCELLIYNWDVMVRVEHML